MVDELAKHAGYLSYDDRKLFKEQIRTALGSESIAEMEEITSVQIKIEELNNFALVNYEYFFNPDWEQIK